MNRDDFRILLTLDKDNRMLTVSDNGIGMTRAELEQNLGTIAHSGSQDFKAENTDENIDIIGQFGADVRQRAWQSPCCPSARR